MFDITFYLTILIMLCNKYRILYYDKSDVQDSRLNLKKSLNKALYL